MQNDPQRLGIPQVQDRKRIIVDFSSPNIAKEMHVGHLRSTIIGDTLSKIFEFLGHDVLRLNHVGDWGTQFGMLIHYMKTNSSLLLNSISPPPPSLSSSSTTTTVTTTLKEYFTTLKIKDLVTFYKEAKKEFDQNPIFQQASREEVVHLQQGELQSLYYWKEICEISRREFQEIYRLLDIHVEERGESYYNPFLSFIVQDLLTKGIALEHKGAVCIFPIGFSLNENDENLTSLLNNDDINHDPLPLPSALPSHSSSHTSSSSSSSSNITSSPNSFSSPSPPLTPLIIRKSDGGYLYGTTDLAALRHRVSEERADMIVYVTDSGQAGHFQLVFEAARRAGYTQRTEGLPAKGENNSASTPIRRPNSTTELIHVPFGVVLGEDGKKLRSRSGETVRLKDLLSEAIKLASLTIQEKQQHQHQKNENKSPHSPPSSSSSSPSPCLPLTPDQLHAATVIGIGTVKYADLCMNRESAYRFSYSKMLSLTGNTAPYLLYAYARIQGIKRKALSEIDNKIIHTDKNEEKKNLKDQELELKNEKIGDGEKEGFYISVPEERALLLHLTKLEEVITGASHSLLPSQICEYLYELSIKFNVFYEHCPVIKAPSPASRRTRTALCSLTADSIKLCLDLLGIQTIDRL